MPRIKLIFFTPKPAPSPNSSLLSTKSSSSCHPSLRPVEKSSVIQNCLVLQKENEGRLREAPSQRSQLMQRSWDKTESGMPCSHSFCFCGQVLLCPSVPGDQASLPAAEHCTEGGGCCPCAERQLHLQPAKWHLIKPRKPNWGAMEECPKWGGRAKSHWQLGIFTGSLSIIPSVLAQCLGHSKSSKNVC